MIDFLDGFENSVFEFKKNEVRVYNSKLNAEIDNGTGLISKYEFKATNKLSAGLSLASERLKRFKTQVNCKCPHCGTRPKGNRNRDNCLNCGGPV